MDVQLYMYVNGSWVEYNPKPASHTHAISNITNLRAELDEKEIWSNKVNAWSSTLSSVKYPSEKLVKESLDGKSDVGHKHTKADITDFAHTHGSITNDGRIGTSSGMYVVTGTGGLLQTTSYVGGDYIYGGYPRIEGIIDSTFEDYIITFTTGGINLGTSYWSGGGYEVNVNNARVTNVATPTQNTDAVNKEYVVDALGQQWKLLRDRTPTTNPISVSAGTSVGGINLGTTINRGDVLAIEVFLNNSSYVYPAKVVIITMNYNTTSPTSTTEHYHTTISRLYGDRLTNYTFTCSYSNQTIYFGNKRYLQGYFSGNEIQWTTNNYTLYVGKVWRLEG